MYMYNVHKVQEYPNFSNKIENIFLKSVEMGIDAREWEGKQEWEEDGIPFAAKIWWIGSVVGATIKLNLSGKLVRQAISNK